MPSTGYSPGPAAAAASSGGGMAPPANIPIAARWYSGHNGLEAGSLVAMVQDKLYLTPIVFPSDVTLDRISIDCSVTNSKNARLGIYSNATSGLARPNALLVESSSFALSTVSGTNDQTISQALSAGTLYWLALNLDGGATIRTYTGADSGFSWGGAAGDGALNTHSRRGFQTHTFGALPADQSGVAITIESGSFPVITVRVAS